MPTPPHYSPPLFFSPCLLECIPLQVICRVTMWTSADDSSMSLVSWDVKSNFVFLSAYTYLIATLLSILVHDGGLELDSLLYEGNSGGNLWSVPSATWVDTPSFMLIASQHPHIIHRSYSSVHVWWSAYFSRWFVEWRCGQVPRIRLCLWWVEMSKLISEWFLLIPTSLLLSFSFSPFWYMMVDWNGTLYFYMGTLVEIWGVPSATWVDMPTFMLIASISCHHPHIIHHSYSSLHVCWSAFLTRWFVEWRCRQEPRIRLCLWWVEMSKVILCF